MAGRLLARSFNVHSDYEDAITIAFIAQYDIIIIWIKLTRKIMIPKTGWQMPFWIYLCQDLLI